jgi:hypothetical protein
LYSKNRLIVVGYGFNNREINQKIFNWPYNPIDRIIIVDPLVEDLKFKFPSLIFGQWDGNE